MEIPAESIRRILFGEFELDPLMRELRTDGRKIKLQEQPFQILAALLERPGQLVTRDELTHRLWPSDTFVDFEHSLNTAVNRLREALEDSAEHPRLIETLPRRGYRFIASVDKLDGGGMSIGTIPERGSATTPATDIRPPSPEARVEKPMLRVLVILGIAVLFMATVAIWFTSSSRRPESLPELTQRQITANSTENTVWSGAISPNGKYLAYADGTSIRLKLMESGDMQTVPEPENLEGDPVRWRIAGWFPDSARFLAVNTRPPMHASTWVVSLIGPPRLLRDDASAWSISQDGGWIAFTANPGWFGAHASFGYHELWVMRADGNDAHKVGETDASSAFSRVKWSTDGTNIIYVKQHLQTDKSEYTIEARSVNGGLPKTLVSHSSLHDFLSLSDGRLIYVVSEPETGDASCNLWETATLDAKPRGQSKRITNWAGYCMDDLSATAHGKVLAFRRWAVQSSAFVADLDLDRKRITNLSRLTLNEGLNVPTGWSADSKTVLFWSRQHGRTGIFKQSLGKDTAEPLVTGSENVQVPRMGPDSRSVLYLLIPRESSPSSPIQLMRVSMNGGQPHPVLSGRVLDTHRCATAVGLCGIAERSGDGRQVIFTSVDLVKGRGRELGRFEVGDSSANYRWDISPDGTRIAVLDGSGAHVTILPLFGKGRRGEFRVKGYRDLRSFDWAPDGKGFFTSSLTAAGSALLHIDLQGNVHILWGMKGSTAAWGVPSLDGRHLVLSAFVVSGNIWTLEHF
jgi:DNA-binding winged helix-turn-helix (wHTH) protein/Tol biopolymer transport system component